MTFGPDAPFVELTIAGTPAGLILGDALKDFQYRDVHHGEVDEVSFKIADTAGLWRGGWAIDEGTEISGMMGYAGLAGAKVPLGAYTVGESDFQSDGGGDVETFHAQAAFTSRELRTERSEAFEAMTLAEIVRKGAGRHGLTVTGEIPSLSFDRLTQERESDLAFWTRLAEDWGCYFSVKGHQLVFTTRASIERLEPVRLFDPRAGQRPIRISLRQSSHRLYSGATVRYLHPQQKRMLRTGVADPRIRNGDTLRLDDRAESQRHAERLCVARLDRANDGFRTGKVKTVGDPLLLAGQVVQLGASYGKYAGRWLVTAAAHRFTASGYTTTISIKGI